MDEFHPASFPDPHGSLDRRRHVDRVVERLHFEFDLFQRTTHGVYPLEVAHISMPNRGTVTVTCIVTASWIERRSICPLQKECWSALQAAKVADTEIRRRELRLDERA